MEAVPLPTTNKRLWSIGPQATQATKTQPKAEQTQTLSPEGNGLSKRSALEVWDRDAEERVGRENG